MSIFDARTNWPDAFDTSTIVVFVMVVVGLPTLGYVFLVLDIRAYLRSLRRALIRVTYYLPEIPKWARYETPPCLRALGLRVPSTEEEVKRAYRRLAEKLHPDRGGDPHRFQLLQEHFEKSRHYVRTVQPEFRSTVR